MQRLHILIRPGLIGVKCDGKIFLHAVSQQIQYCAASQQQIGSFFQKEKCNF